MTSGTSFSLYLPTDGPMGEEMVTSILEPATPFIPLTTAVSSTSVLASLLLFPAAIVVVTGPSPADQYSLIGALAAAVITLVAVRKFDQSLWNGTAAFTGALVGGVATPGTLLSWGLWKGWITEKDYSFVTWHSWTLLGLICGLGGWVAAQSVYQTFTKIIPGVASVFGDRLTRFFKP